MRVKRGASPELREGARSAQTVAVCAITYNRNEGLRRLLDALELLSFPAQTAPKVVVVVVDNNEAPTAQPVVADASGSSRWEMRYRHEPRPGIPTARNAAIAEAHDSDFIVFIDDDEVPDPHWLDELLRVQTEYGCELVTGPVVSAFDASPPEWMSRWGVFDRARHKTGEQVSVAGTGNLLIRSAFLEVERVRFDERFRSGSDTAFCLEATRRGARILWADEAVVRETVSSSRLSLGWLLRRWFRGANNYAVAEARVHRGVFVRVLRVGKGAARLLQGFGTLVLGGFSWRASVALAGARKLATGSGMLMGAVGFNYNEYKRPRSGSRAP